MEDKTQEAVDQLTGMLGDKNVETEVRAAQLVDPVDSLRRTIFGFFEERLQVIAEKEDMKREIEEAILEKVRSEEIKVEQLLQIYRAVYDKTNDAIDALLAVFRPGKDGSTTPLLEDRTPRGQEAGGNVEEIFANASREELEKIGKVYRMIQSVLEQEKKAEESS